MSELGTLTIHSAVTGTQYVTEFLSNTVYPALRDFQVLPEKHMHGGFLLCEPQAPYPVRYRIRHELRTMPHREVVHLDDDLDIPVSTIAYHWPTRPDDMPDANDLRTLMHCPTLLPAKTVGTVLIHAEDSGAKIPDPLKRAVQKCFRQYFQSPNKFSSS